MRIGNLTLLNGVISNDLERPQTQISMSRRYLTLNISETVRDTDIITTKYQYGLNAVLRSHFSDLD